MKLKDIVKEFSYPMGQVVSNPYHTAFQPIQEDETQDPQEIMVGNYQTRHYDICPGASVLYKDIESKGVDMDLAERTARLQDVLFYMEKHLVEEMKSATEEDVLMAKNLQHQIMAMANMMGLKTEHSYIQGHIDVIEKLAGTVEESLEEGKVTKTFHFKGKTSTDIDEIDADFSRQGIKSKPDFNNMKVTVTGDERKIDKIAKFYRGVEESVNEAKSVTLITYGGREIKYKNSDIDKFIRNLDLNGEELPGLIYKASMSNPNIIGRGAKSLNKKKEAILQLLKKIKSHSGDVIIDVDSKKPSFKHTVRFGLPESIEEATLSQIHATAKKGSYPVTVVAVDLGRVIDQELVKTPMAVPAAFMMMQGAYPKAKIHVEDKTGKILFKESVNESKYTDQTGIKSSLLRNSEFFSLLNQKEKNWIRGNDVKIYKDRFGFIFTDGKMEMVANLKKPMSIIKSLGRARNEIKKIYNQNESVNEAKEPEVISQLRSIVKDQQNKKIKDPVSGKMMRVDLYSASAVTQVYDAISKSNKDKFGKLSLPKMVNVAFKMIK